MTEIDPPFIPEDRLSLNPNNVAAVQVASRWKVVDGSHWILDFDQKRAAAERAASVIKHYGLSFICFVGRPSCPGEQPMMYWLNEQGKSPSGSMPGEDAVPFNRNVIAVTKIGQRWKIADGNNWLLDFGPAQGNAKAALHFIKRYGFNYICFVGRPHPPMTYFRQ